MFDLDRYYTPDHVADSLLEHVGASKLEFCVDSACGDGSLLLAAQRAFKSVRCAGIDKDNAAIRRLRRRYPDWRLSVADVLNLKMQPRSVASARTTGCDLLALNPPFSLGRTKSVEVAFRGTRLRSSIAMAHVLRSADLFTPSQGAVAIVPESLLYSEVDEVARRALTTAYQLQVVAELTNTTFSGARANAVIVRLTPTQTQDQHFRSGRQPLLAAQLIRGGLPVFEAIRSRNGLPFLHSSDIAATISSGGITHCRRVRAIERGRVAGVVVLLPRVGLPSKSTLKPVYLRSTVQLSDCVFALRFPNTEAGIAFTNRVRRRWSALLGLYHGTGARYVTKRRLEAWLATV